VKEASFASYETLLHKHVLPWFGDAADISETDLQEFVLEKLDAGYSLSSVQLMVLVVRMILRFGASRGMCGEPRWHIRYPSVHNGRPLKLFSLQEQRQIVHYVQEHPSPRNLGIYFALATGLRIGELCGLQWKDIDLPAGVVHVGKTLSRIWHQGRDGPGTELVLGSPKTPSSQRDVPIPDDFEALLKTMPHPEGDDFFLTAGPKPTEPRTYRNYFNTFLDGLGLARRNFHALRHSFATRCIEAGFDAKTVSALLGHSSISTTLDLYVHPGYDKKKACVNSINFNP